MTVVGAGGVVFCEISSQRSFERAYKRLTATQRELADAKLRDLLTDPRPPGLRFEKLKGYRKPNLYTLHIDGNYKISFSVDGDVAILRNVGTHNEIDRAP